MNKKFIFIFAFVFLAFAMFPNVSALPPITNGLDGYWTLNQTTGDFIDSRGNFTTSSYGGIVRGQNGISNNSVLADGNDFINVMPGYEGFSELTINLWVNVSNWSNGGDMEIFSRWANGAGDRDILLRNQNGNSWSFILTNGSFNEELQVSQYPSVGEFHMITFTYDGSHMAMYINGTQYGNTTHSGTTPGLSTNPPFNIVGDVDNANGWDGNVDEVAFYSRGLSPSEVLELYNEFTFPTRVSTILDSPTDGISFVDSSQDFQATLTPTNLNLTNATINIWYNNGSLLTKQTNTVTGDVLNSTIFTVNNLPVGDFKWNVLGRGINSTGSTFDDWASTNFTFSREIIEINSTFNSSTFETKKESFIQSIQVPESSTISDVTLWWNGSDKGGSSSLIAGNNYSLMTSFDIPLVTGNVNFYWNVTFSTGETFKLTTNQQEVNQTSFGIFNSTLGDVFLNITFKDENNLQEINASVPLSTFTYYLGDGTVNKTFTYSNNTDHLSYAFGGTTGDLSLKVIPVFQYRRLNDYPQRIWQPGQKTYNSDTTNQTLYLLSDDDGIFVTYQVLTVGESPIEDVSVTSTRVISGETIEVASGLTDAAGTVTFWLNPDFQHTTTFIKSGFDTFVFTHFPTQTSYTITLGEEEEVPDDCTQGILQTIEPTSAFLFNGTIHNFNYSISSSYWNLSSFQFALTDEEGAVIASNSSSSSNGGIVSASGINVTQYSQIIMTYTYTIADESDLCDQVSYDKVWIIQSTEGRDYSIWKLFQDFDRHVSSGIFGFDDFGKTILSFVVIVFTVGGLTRRYGFANEATAMGALFSIVLLLDFGLNFIPAISIGNIEVTRNFYTLVTALILLGFIIREETR